MLSEVNVHLSQEALHDSTAEIPVTKLNQTEIRPPSTYVGPDVHRALAPTQKVVSRKQIEVIFEANVIKLSLTPGLGRSPGEGNGCPLQYSGLENSMDYIAHGVTKSRTGMCDFLFHFPELGSFFPSPPLSPPFFLSLLLRLG